MAGALDNSRWMCRQSAKVVGFAAGAVYHARALALCSSGSLASMVTPTFARGQDLGSVTVASRIERKNVAALEASAL